MAYQPPSPSIWLAVPSLRCGLSLHHFLYRSISGQLSVAASASSASRRSHAGSESEPGQEGDGMSCWLFILTKYKLFSHIVAVLSISSVSPPSSLHGSIVKVPSATPPITISPTVNEVIRWSHDHVASWLLANKLSPVMDK